MKRTELKRKTPLKTKTPMRRAPMRRTASTLKRTPLRKRSKARAKSDREIMPARREYLCEFDRCAYPCCRKSAACVHEIAFGNGVRPQAVKDPATWLPSCIEHNKSGQGFHDVMRMPIVAQLALKMILDFSRYDRERVNEMRGKARDAITQAEVDTAAKELKASTKGSLSLLVGRHLQ